MSILKKFFNQTRKPEGFLGKLMLASMNGGHAKMAEWGMSTLPLMDPKEILEIGCGAGGNVQRLAKRYPDAHITGVDYSPASVEKTKAVNRKRIQEGKCTVLQQDVSKLDLAENTYDLATAFETIYFWPGLEHCFGEVYRVLKDGGRFLIVNESDGLDETGAKFEGIIEGMKCYRWEEIKEALEKAGFCDVRVYPKASKHWLAVQAVKKVKDASGL